MLKQFIVGNQVKADKCEAINIILCVISMYVKNPGVCEQGCGALWSIVSNNSKFDKTKL